MVPPCFGRLRVNRAALIRNTVTPVTTLLTVLTGVNPAHPTGRHVRRSGCNSRGHSRGAHAPASTKPGSLGGTVPLLVPFTVA